MGSNWFTTYSRGKNIKEAYDSAVENAEDVHGHQEGYSGEINSSAGFRDVTKEFKASKKSIAQFMDESVHRLTKHQGAQAICIEEPKDNENKIKTQVEHIVTPGTKKWVLYYTVEADMHVGSFTTKGEAVTKARAYTEKTGKFSRVKVEKRLEKGESTVAKITYKKSSTEKEGRWVFFGWASY